MKKKSYIKIAGFLTGLGLILGGCGTDSSTEVKQPPVKEDEKVDEAPVVEQGKFYYTANEGGSISKINAEINQVEKTIKAEGTVHNIQVSPDGKIYAATLVPNMGDHGDMEMNGTAVFYNSETDELVKEVEVGNHPAHIVFTEDGKFALVTNNEDNTVSVIDIETYNVVNTVETGTGPHGFRISNDSKFAYVANMGEDTISVIEIDSMKEVKKIQVGQTPVTTGITGDGKTLVATVNAENALSLVDLTNGEVAKVEVGKGPAQVYIDSSNEFAYVANQGTKNDPSNSVTIVDLKAKAAVSTIETGEGAHGVVTSSDNKFLYVTNMFENTVSVIDLATKKVTETITVGEVPNGISIMK